MGRRMSILGDLGNSILDKLKDSIKSKYGISGMTYPSDLMSSAYGHSYVLFNINVNSRSAIVRESASPISGLSSDLGSELAGQFTKLTNTTGIDPLLNRSTKRLAASIALYTPNELEITYGAHWNEISAPIVSGLMEGGDSVLRYASNLAGTQMPTDMTGGQLTGVGAEGVMALGLGLTKGLGTGAITGMAPNPKKEQQFEGVQFRKFNMHYVFAPRDAAEAENVQKIITQFKYHMHPEFLTASKFIYVYPSEFDIEYHYKSGHNPHIHRHTTAVLENMTVNYTPNSVYSIYDTGMPTQIVVTLQFVELMVVTKETINKGM